MVVNASKCEAMVFGAGNAWPNKRSWTLPSVGGGSRQPLAVVSQFKYLGLEVRGAARSFKACAAHRHGSMRAAQSAVHRRMKELRIPCDPDIVTGLFASITAAAGSYACEVWATPFLHKWHLKARECALHGYQAAIYKMCLGVPSSTSSLLAFFEAGRYPLQVQWLARAVRYWNKLTRLGQGSSLLAKVFKANVEYSLGHGRANCWAAELRAGLQFVWPNPGWTAHMLQARSIDDRMVRGAAQQAFSQQLQVFTDPPYGDSCAHRQSCKYAAYMLIGGVGADHDCLPRPAYLRTAAPLKQKRALARLRLGAAPIRTNQTHAVPFSQRRCTRCSRGVDTEHHLMFDCRALATTRAEHRGDLPLSGRSMQALMSGVYDDDRVRSILSFVYNMIEAIPGPSA